MSDFTKLAGMRLLKWILPVVAILCAVLSLVLGGLIAGMMEFFLSNYNIYPTENHKIFGSIVIFTSRFSIYLCYKIVVKERGILVFHISLCVGKGRIRRMLSVPVLTIASRSIPIPTPPVGGSPYAISSTYDQSCSSS